MNTAEETLLQQVRTNVLLATRKTVAKHGGDIGILFKGYFLPKNDSSGNRILHYTDKGNSVEYSFDCGGCNYTGVFNKEELKAPQ